MAGLAAESLPSAGGPDLSSAGKCAGAKGTPKNKFINSYIFIFPSSNSALVCRGQNFYLSQFTPHWSTMKSYALILLLACSIGYAQQLPKNPNITDAKGRRQGMWTVWLNKNNDETARKDSMVYYRTIEYKDNKPTGEVRD